MSLKDICYKQIKNNFWYGIFGDFKLIIDKDTGYFNATKLCNSAGKEFHKWSRLQSSKELLAYYGIRLDPQIWGSSLYGNRADTQICASALYEIKAYNKDSIDKIISGTYLKQELILSVALWLSIDFYDKCYKIIIDYFVRDFKQYKDDNGKLRSKIQDIEENLKILSFKNESLENKVGLLKPTCAPYTDSDKDNCLVIFDKMDYNATYQYYAIRCQKRSLFEAMKNAYVNFPFLEVVYEKIPDPNSIKLFLLAKERLEFKSYMNHFNTHLSRKELEEKMDNLYDEILLTKQ